MTPDDIELLVELDSDPEVMHFLTGGEPTPKEQFENEILPRWLGYYTKYTGFGYWAAIEKTSGKFIGWFEFVPLKESHTDEVELGYRLRRAVWGRGYATEGARALIAKGFTDLGVRRVVANTMAANTASRRVMEKVGMTLARTFRTPWTGKAIEGIDQGEVEYELIESVWKRDLP